MSDHDNEQEHVHDPQLKYGVSPQLIAEFTECISRRKAASHLAHHGHLVPTQTWTNVVGFKENSFKDEVLGVFILTLSLEMTHNPLPTPDIVHRAIISVSKNMTVELVILLLPNMNCKCRKDKVDGRYLVILTRGGSDTKFYYDDIGQRDGFSRQLNAVINRLAEPSSTSPYAYSHRM